MPDYNKCKIISDGSPAGTRIVGKDGADLTMMLAISRVTWSVDAHELAKVTIEGHGWEIDATAPTSEVVIQPDDAPHN